MSNMQLTISNKVIDHLGINLYNSLPAVLFELIANSYDAQASEVFINIKKKTNAKNEILVYDNGKGMDIDHFKNKYLEIAKDSRTNSSLDLNRQRVKIGRKGLGKLSVYGISDTVCIYTKTINDRKILAVEINYKEASQDDDYRVKEINENEIPSDIIGWFKNYECGTVTYINSCRRNFNEPTLSKLENEIQKNFYLVLENESDPFNISLKIHDEDQKKISKVKPIFDCDYVFKFSDLSCKFISNPNVLELSPELTQTLKAEWNEKLNNSSNDDLFFANVFNTKTKMENKLPINIKGWLGTLKSLSNNNKNNIGVPIIVRNRIVKSNIIDEFSIDRFWDKYFVGELIMEFMDENDIEDVISPNRQGFDSNVDDRYDKVKFIILRIVNMLIKEKDKRKKEISEKNTKKIKDYNSRFSNLIDILDAPEQVKNQLKSNYTNTTGLKTINDKYIIFISHCSKNRCSKSYEMSQFLFNVINEAAKMTNDFEIERIVYTADKEHEGRLKPSENIYEWMKKNALNEKYPNAIFLSCLSEDFLRNWNTIIEYGASWAVDKKNYAFVYDRQRLSDYAHKNSIQSEPLRLDRQNFDFKSDLKSAAIFLADIFDNKISIETFEKVIKEKDYYDYKVNDCTKCNDFVVDPTKFI